MKTKTIILYALTLLLCLGNVKLSAQESYLKNRWNIKASYAPYAAGWIS